MAKPPVYAITVPPQKGLGDTVIWNAVRTLAMADGSPHVRQCAIYLPMLFVETPHVSVQIVASEGATPMWVYALKVNDFLQGNDECTSGHCTQIAIEAQTIYGGKASGTFHATFSVAGVPRA